MAKVGEGNKLKEFIGLLEKLAEDEKNRPHAKDDDVCEPLQPSRDWSKIKAVKFTKDVIETATKSFTPKYSAVEISFLKSSPSPKSRGREIHELLNKFIRKRRGEKIKLGLEPNEEEQLKKFVEDIEEQFGFRILVSELSIRGYANHENLDKPHRWKGKIDAIGVVNDDIIIVVDWTTYGTSSGEDFWASKESLRKLHQAMIYRNLIKVQWEDSREEVLPKVNILIVPIPSKYTGVSDPRLCSDFEKLQRARFFDEIDKFNWTAQKPSKDEKGEDYSRKHKTPDGDCGDKVKSILEPPLPSYERKPTAVKQKELIRQMADRQHPFGRTPTDSYRTAQMSGIIKQESTVKAEGEDYSRELKTPDGDCSNKLKLILEPLLSRHEKEVKEVRKPIAVKQEEPIRQLPDRQHPFGRTPTDSYRTAEMCDTQNAAVGRVTQMPDFQHHIARTPVYRYYTPEEALQLNSPYIQPGISAAQMAYRESAESKAYHFMSQEKAGCSCHGRKKCAHAQGAGQCDCKAAGKKCGYNCNCDEEICTNRGIMNIRREEEDYSRNYTAFEDYCGYGRYVSGCSCHGRKKCAHARGAGQCDCKAAGKKCGYNCNCDEWICANRAW